MQNQSDFTQAAQQENLAAQQQFATDTANINMENTKFDVYYNLALANKLSARQFEKLTGIPITVYSNAKKQKPTVKGFFDTPDNSYWNEATRGDIKTWIEDQVNQGNMTDQQALELWNKREYVL